jgi:hypothetical protein
VPVTHIALERTMQTSDDEYHRLKHRDRQVLTLADFTDKGTGVIQGVRPELTH